MAYYLFAFVCVCALPPSRLNAWFPPLSLCVSDNLSQQMAQSPITSMVERASSLDPYVLPMMAAPQLGGNTLSNQMEFSSIDALKSGRKRSAACVFDAPHGAFLYPGMMPDQQPMRFLDPSQFFAMAGYSPFVTVATASQQQQQLVEFYPFLLCIRFKIYNPFSKQAIQNQ